VKHENVPRRSNEGGNILQTIKPRKTSYIAHMLGRNCLLKHATEGRYKEKYTGREEEDEEVTSY
jgi:hypothetical protein